MDTARVRWTSRTASGRARGAVVAGGREQGGAVARAVIVAVVCGALGFLACVLGLAGVAGASVPVGPAHAAEPSPGGSLAGSRAGVGRTPPGRALPDPDHDAAALPPPEAQPSASTPPSARPQRPGTEQPATSARGQGAEAPLGNVVPLGAGLLLTGLGLGFLALRLRR
ncbi:hypothetical protein [Streptomyces sp. NPDC046939]|uniref:hypothetical protein n=1 Tax=Streptomyces sp. NPDC046939 TaxID=3155376 RepID=UPI00340FD82E